MDVSSDEFTRFLDEMRKSAGSLSRITEHLAKMNGGNSSSTKKRGNGPDDTMEINRGFAGLGNATKRLSGDFEGVGSSFGKASIKVQQTAVSTFRAIGGSAEGMMATITQTMKTGFMGILGGAVIGSLVEEGHHLYKNYQELSNIGQTFGGSMIEMGKAAAEAEMPLGEFAKMLEHSSTAGAVLADSSSQSGKSLGALQKGVRDNLREFGFYGMSLSQISGLTGDYAETVRISGSSTLRNKDAMTRGITQFATDISDFSKVTGKNREQIAAATTGALKDVTFAAINLTEAQRLAVTKSTTFLAAMPGETGDVLSRMLTQTVGRGAAYLSDQGKEFASVGASQLNALVQNLADKSLKGAVSTTDFVGFKKGVDEYYEQNKATLSRLAMAGNASAAHTLTYLQSMQGIDAKRYNEMMEQQKTSASFGIIMDTLTRLGSSFQAGLLNALEPLDKLGNPDNVKRFELFAASMTSLGAAVGDLIVKVFTPEHISDMGAGISWLATTGVPNIVDIAKYVFGILKIAGGVIKTFFSIIGWVNDRIFGETTALIASLEILGVYLGSKLIKLLLKSTMFSTITVKGAIINVEGAKGVGNAIADAASGAHQTPAEKKAAAAAEKKTAAEAIKNSNKGKMGRLLGGAKGLLGGLLGGMIGIDAIKRLMSSKIPTEPVELEPKAKVAEPEPAKTKAETETKPKTGEPEPAKTKAETETKPKVEPEAKPAEPAKATGAATAIEDAEKLAKTAAEDAMKAPWWKRAVTSALGGAASAGKVAALWGGKMIPTVGAGVMAYSATDRASHGDLTGASLDTFGATLDASGYGTPINWGLQIGMIIRDLLGRENFDKYTGLDSLKINESDIANRIQRGLNDITGMGVAPEPDPAVPATSEPFFDPNATQDAVDKILGPMSDATTQQEGPLAGSNAADLRELVKLTAAQLELQQQKFAADQMIARAQIEMQRRVAISQEQVAAMI